MNIEKFKEQYKPILTGIDDVTIIHDTPHQLRKALSYPLSQIWVVEDTQIKPYTSGDTGNGLVVTIVEHNFKNITINI